MKKLFQGFRNRDDGMFLLAARELIEEERKKSHVKLAQELARILDEPAARPPLSPPTLLKLPKDNERNVSLFDIREPQRYFGDLILRDKTREHLSRAIDEVRQRDLLEAYGVHPARKLLFCGPPGCGKTAGAEAIATALGLPLLYVRFDAVVSSLLGETAANLRKTFEYVSRGTWVVLFDEFDAIGRSRDDISEHGELRRVVSSFLQLLDNFNGRSLLIAATNYEAALDKALWRRFDDIIRFELPTEQEIRQLLSHKLGSRIEKPDIVRAAHRLRGASYAEVERVYLDATKSGLLSGRDGPNAEDLNASVTRQLDRSAANPSVVPGSVAE